MFSKHRLSVQLQFRVKPAYVVRWLDTGLRISGGFVCSGVWYFVEVLFSMPRSVELPPRAAVDGVNDTTRALMRIYCPCLCGGGWSVTATLVGDLYGGAFDDTYWLLVCGLGTSIPVSYMYSTI